MIDSEMLLRAVRFICGKKRESGVHPEMATSREVARVLGTGVAEVERSAELLLRAGRISIRRGINYDSYRIMT